MASEEKAQSKEKKELSIEASLKSEDTEEWLDIHFTRKIGFLWAKIAIPLHITPNMITIASIFIGAFGGALFYYDNLQYNIIGMLLFVLANTFDSADGQLARLTDNKTKLGRILDGMAGDIWFIIIYIVLTLRTLNDNIMSPYVVWTIAILAGASHVLAAAMADYYRNVHLFLIKGEQGSEHDSYRGVVEELKKVKFFKQPFKKVSLMVYANYTKTQETISPKVKNFFLSLYSKYPDGADKEMFAKMRLENKKYMPLTNILQFNTRTIALFITIFLNKVWLYFCFDIVVMNTILIYLVVKQEKLFGDYTKKLSDK